MSVVAEERLRRIREPCARRGPKGVACGGMVVSNAHGEPVCLRCVRREAGICRECPRQVEGTRGKVELCPECKKQSLKTANERWYYGKLEANRKRAREKKRIDPERPVPRKESLARANAAAAVKFGGCGEARAAALSPERRTEIARAAGKARWAQARAPKPEVG